MRESVIVALAAVDSQPGQLADNLAEIDATCVEVAGQGADLVLFPELSLSGFVPNHPTGNHEQWLRQSLQAVVDMSETLDGPHIKTLIDISRRTGLLISVGLLEDAGNLCFNTQVIVGPDGLLGRWRKMHIPMYEQPFYIGGDGPTVVQTPLGRIGVNICFDAFMPESTRLLAVQQVEIVLFPFAADPPPGTAESWAKWASPALRARCVENGVFGVACNYRGHVELAGVAQTFPGGGVVLGPRGESIADWCMPAAAPGHLLAELRQSVLTCARAEPEYLFRFRRPDLYGPLASG